MEIIRTIYNTISDIYSKLINGITTLDELHEKVHEGKLSNISDISLGINIVSPKQILLITPNTLTRIIFYSI